jgi:iron complex transport system substrate-binding protein
VASRPVSDEELRDAAPDAIVLSWCGVEEHKYRPDVVYRNPLWQGVPAVRDQRVVSITEAWLGRPSPRLVDGYRALCRLVASIDGRGIDRVPQSDP